LEHHNGDRAYLERPGEEKDHVVIRLTWRDVSRLRVGAVGLVTLAAVTSVLACSGGCRLVSTPTAGFWFEGGSFALPPDVATRLGGPIRDQEMDSIKQLSRTEIERAFSDLGIGVTTNTKAFWRVEVLQSLPVRTHQQLPNAGESLALGVLGGTGAVGFDLVALKTIHYTPAGVSRQGVIEGIGRGIGRVAVHEFMHQILGAAALHDDDQDSYEYGSPDRPSQYYGELHWTTAWPLLRQRFGK
jgi:hypothetical protein